MATFMDLVTRINELSYRTARLETFSNLYIQRGEKTDNSVTDETFKQEIETINNKIQELKNSDKDKQEKAEIKNLIIGKKNELIKKAFLWNRLKISLLAFTILFSVTTFFVLKMSYANMTREVRIDLGAALTVLAVLSLLLFPGLYLDKKSGTMPFVILISAILFSVITIYILKMEAESIPDWLRIDLSAGLSLLTALLTLLFVSLCLDKTKKPEDVQNKIKNLEQLQAKLANPETKNDDVRQEYLNLI